MTTANQGAQGRLRRWTLAGRLLATVVIILAIVLALVAMGRWLGLPDGFTLVASGVSGLALGTLGVHWATAPYYRKLQALRDGADSLQDRDFSIQLARDKDADLSELIDAFNHAARALNEERHDLYQRELMLHTIVENAPLALVLMGPNGRVRLSNRTANQLFGLTPQDAGSTFLEILERCPQAVRDAVGRGTDALVSFERHGREETFHLLHRSFTLNTIPHQMILFRPMTQELHREEVLAWKKIIRIIAHELNNSLAPISSLIHSARKVADRPDSAAQLERIFRALQGRLDHLLQFLEGYARFARLPDPDPHPIVWRDFLQRMQGLYAFQIAGNVPSHLTSVDEAQLEQLIINLITNAREAGSKDEDIHVSVEDRGVEIALVISDRGSGMSDEVMKRATLPFFSTKDTGSGLGLALCREIAERHGGRLELANRVEGGMVVTATLPKNIRMNEI